MYGGVNLKELSSKDYYNWVEYWLYNDTLKECEPPYTNFDNMHCYDIGNRTNPPEILKCYTGLITYYCKDDDIAIENGFSGYLLDSYVSWFLVNNFLR